MTSEFVGRYDTEVWQTLQSFRSPSLGMPELNQNIQHTFRQIACHYQAMPVQRVLSLVTDLEASSANGSTLTVLSNLRRCLGSVSVLTDDDLLVAIQAIGDSALSLAATLGNVAPLEITASAFTLHRCKNEAYDDGWYSLGAFGVFMDLRRKCYRLGTLLPAGRESPVKDETLYDTAVDTLNYSALLKVAVLYLPESHDLWPSLDVVLPTNQQGESS